MPHQVVILPRAKRDLPEHYQWIAERSTDGANRRTAAFENGTTYLLENLTGPGRRSPSLALRASVGSGKH